MTLSVSEERKLQLQRWRILLLSPIVWTTCFGLLYLLDEAVCGLHFWRWFVWDNVTVVIPVMLLLLLLTFGVIIGNTYSSWVLWRQAYTSTRSKDAVERDRFIGAAGLMMGTLFVFLTVGLTAVVIWLQPC